MHESFYSMSYFTVNHLSAVERTEKFVGQKLGLFVVHAVGVLHLLQFRTNDKDLVRLVPGHGDRIPLLSA